MQIEIDSAAAQNLIASFPNEMFAIFKDAVEISTLNVHRKVTNNFGIGGNKLHSRSGRLKRSLITIVGGNSISRLSGKVQAGGGTQQVKYAILQEKGGTIRPKNNKYAGVPGGPYLNVPLPPNKTAAGVMRKTARTIFSEGGFIAKSRRGNWLVMSRQGVPMFYLKKESKIKARLGMIDAKDNEIPVLMQNIQTGIDNFIS